MLPDVLLCLRHLLFLKAGRFSTCKCSLEPEPCLMNQGLSAIGQLHSVHIFTKHLDDEQVECADLLPSLFISCFSGRMPSCRQQCVFLLMPMSICLCLVKDVLNQMMLTGSAGEGMLHTLVDTALHGLDKPCYLWLAVIHEPGYF